MTKTALANREIRSKEHIAYADRVTKSEIARKQRNLEREEGAKNRAAQIASSAIGAVGRMGGSAIGAAGSKAAAAARAASAVSRNDPEWYKNYVKDLGEFVNVPTFDRLGAQKFSDLYLFHNNKKYTVPGIMIFEYIPTVGPQENGASHFRNAVNQTLSRTKEKVLALNSRSSVNWEAADLGYNFFASADLVTLICDLKRAILVYQTYHANNAYLARALLEALGWTWTDFVEHYAEYRKLYVLLVQRFNTTIVAPKSASLFNRKMYLASNVFVDTDETGYIRQMYAFKPIKYLQLSDTGEMCVMLNVTKTDYYAFKNALMLTFDRIASNPDFLEMYQDLRHAFGTDIVQLDESVAGESIVFNDVALNREQIHNMSIGPLIKRQSDAVLVKSDIRNLNWGVRQDSNGYLYQGGLTSARDRQIYSANVFTGLSAAQKAVIEAAVDRIYGHAFNKIMNVHKEHVTGDDILDITRLVFQGVRWTDDTEPDTLNLIITGVGTELVLSALTYVYESTGDTLSSYRISSLLFGDPALGSLLMFECSLASVFDWCPMYQCEIYDFVNNTVQGYYTFMDAHTTFEVARPNLYHIHEICVMSELFVTDSNFK